jgi:anti-sigma regulatory factor (Ser/Thr protein kinase)
VTDGWQGIRVSIFSEACYLAPIRTIIREATGLAGLSEEESAAVELAVTEGCANVIRHCYGDCPDERIDLVFTFRDGEFEVRIDDYGKFVDPQQMKGRRLDDVKPGGLGLHFMRKVMDEVRFERNRWGGTRLTLVKRVPGKDGKAQRGGASGEKHGDAGQS